MSILKIIDKINLVFYRILSIVILTLVNAKKKTLKRFVTQITKNEMFSIFFLNKLPYLNGFNKEFQKIGCN